jgi:hypothetical protein
MKSFLGWISHKAPVLITYTVLLVATAALFIFKQNSLIPGANIYEEVVKDRIVAYEYPWRASVDAPYITVSWLVSKAVFADPLVSARFVAGIASVLSVLMFYHLLRNWLLSPGKAVVGTVLFATSSWTLALGRGAHAATVGIFLLLLIFTFGTRLLFTTRPFIDWLLLTSATILSLYTPIVPWLVFMIGAVSMLHYNKRQRSLPLKIWQKVTLWIVGALLAAPLVWSLFLNPDQGLVLLGVDSLVETIPLVVLNILDAIKTIFFIGLPGMPLGLGNLPMLDIFSVFMFLLGCYYFERRLSLKRSKLLFGGFTIALVVCSLGAFNFIQYSVLLPIVYIFISAGVHESITRWLNVFPRNPVARSVGVVVLAITIGFVGSYHLHKIYIARPGNPEIRSLYEPK